MKLKLRNQLFESSKSSVGTFWYVPTQSVREDDVKLESGTKSVFSQLGFGVILSLFEFHGYGLNSDAKRSRNWFIVGFSTLVTLSVAVEAVCQLYQAVLNAHTDPAELTCLNVACATIRLGITSQYLYICWTFATFRNRIQRLVTALHLNVNDHAMISKFSSKSKKFVWLIVVFTLVNLAIVIGNFEIVDLQPGVIVSEVLQALWVVLVPSCCASYIFLLIFLSQVVNEFTDWFLPAPNCDGTAVQVKTVGEHERRHQMVSDLLGHLSVIYSKFLMVSLIIELAVVILFTKGATAFRYPGYTYFVLMSAIQMGFLVIKNVYSSSLNEKVKVLLTFNSKPASISDLQICSPEHISYIMYLNLKQSSNQGELSYGGFFPVRTAFIFSVAGTAITYAVLLREMK